MREIKFQSWWGAKRAMCSEADTLYQLDGYNKTRFCRRKNQEGLLLEAVKQAHEQRKVYFITIFEDGKPYCYITFTSVFISVDFFDELNRCCKSYQFDKTDNPDKLILSFVDTYEYDDDTNDFAKSTLMSYKKDGTFAYTISSGRFSYKEIYHAHEKVDITANYAPYPEFGHYDELIRTDRNLFVDYKSLRCTKTVIKDHVETVEEV